MEYCLFWQDCVFENLSDSIFFQSFFFEKRVSQFLQARHVGLQDSLGSTSSFLDKLRDLSINFLGGRITIGSLVSHAIEHHTTIVFMEDLVAQLRAHSLFTNHIAGDFRCIAEVRTSTSRNAIFTIDHLFGNTPTKRSGQDILSLIDIGVEIVIASLWERGF